MKVLLLDNWCDEAKEIIDSIYDIEITRCGKQLSPPEAYDGIIYSLSNKQEFPLERYSGLKFIASGTTGLDHIDTDYCRSHGIDIIHLDDREFLNDVWATAEHTWALILSLIRKVPFAHADVCAGNWNREAWQGTELRGKNLGIVGYGRCGRQVARIANAFGMNIVHHDQTVTYALGSHSMSYVFQESDIITVHVPLNDQTRGMFGHEQFAMMKPTAYFVNTSRGAVVEESSLWRALHEKKIAGAALDVCSGDKGGLWYPLQDYAMNNNNLIITPHIAGNTAESRRKTQLYIANRIKDYIGGVSI